MNRANFNQLGGFPLETETLNNVQEAYTIFNAYGELAGNKTIVKGCEIVGDEVNDGFIYLDGELLEFRGGLAESEIIVREEIIEVEFETKEMKPTYYKRWAEFGSGLNSIRWSDFRRAYPLSSALFVGELRMYAGLLSEIPFGWHIADGTYGTFDMRDRFPVAFNPENPDYDTQGKTGGAKEVTLTENEMPAHNHTASTASAGSHFHRLKDGSGGDKTNSITTGGGNLAGQDNASNWVSDDSIIESAGAHTHSVTINNKGGGEAHENRPPYKVVAFIQFTGQ